MVCGTACASIALDDGCFEKRTHSVERYHNAVVRQLILADSQVPADYTANALRSAEADMIVACEPIDRRTQLGAPSSGQLDGCEEATAEVELRMQELVPGSH